MADDVARGEAAGGARSKTRPHVGSREHDVDRDVQGEAAGGARRKTRPPGVRTQPDPVVVDTVVQGEAAGGAQPRSRTPMVRSQYEPALLWDTPFRRVFQWASPTLVTTVPSPVAEDEMDNEFDQDQNSMEHIRGSEAFPKKFYRPEDPSLAVAFPHLAGEYVEHMGRITDGVITLSNYRLFIQIKLTYYSIALGLIDVIECRDIFFLYIHCKDARTIRCTFANNEHCQDWYKRLLVATAPPKKLEDVYAFAQYAWLSEESKEDPHSVYAMEPLCPNFENEVQRMGFDLRMAWRICDKNTDYSLCSSYPQQILVPRSIKDEDLANVASFRSSQRIPAVVWRHQGNGSVIARCSQPEVGWLGWRNSNDENLIQAIALSCACNGNNLVHENGDARNFAPTIPPSDSSATDESKNSLRKVLIVDARSYAAAVANRAKGGGCECPEYYPNCEIQFMSLANIHSIRRSFQSVRALCAVHTDQPNWFSLLEGTKWLQHISGLLKSALIVVNAVDREARPVLVHCSDGWDRTPQIVALAELMLDPYYRTFGGFQVLVQREWLEFGHKFGDRCGHGLQADDTNERCPVFLQWLDCVYQLYCQFSTCFEFNDSFLVRLTQHVYSCLFGTFLCNSSQEREHHRVKLRTYSVWAFLQNDEKTYRNYLYKEADQVLHPACQVRDLVLWSDVYKPKNESTEELAVCIDSSNTSTPQDGEEVDGTEQIANDIANVGTNSMGSSPLSKTRSYVDLASAVDYSPGRQRRSSDSSVIDGLRSESTDSTINGDTSRSKFGDESEEDDEVGNSKTVNGESKSAEKSGCVPVTPCGTSINTNGYTEDEDEDSLDETLAERRMSSECTGKVRKISDSDNEDDTEPAASVTPLPLTTIESSTDTLVGDLTPEAKAHVSNELAPCPARGSCCKGAAPGQCSEASAGDCGAMRPPAENCCSDAQDSSLHASTSTSDISDSHVGAAEGGAVANHHKLPQAYLLPHPQLTNGHVPPSMSWNGLPNGFEHLVNGHAREYAGLPKCSCMSGNSGANGHRRPAEVGIETLKQLNSYGRSCSAISTPPHSRTPSSGFPATPSDDRSSDVSTQRGMSAISRKLDSDGLPLMNVKEQQRLHEIIANHQECVRRLEYRVLLAHLALYQQVCQNCSAQKRTTEPSDEVGSLPDSLANVEQQSLGQESTAASDISWEQVDEQETRPTLWVPDHAVNRCAGCDTEFCMVRRKHHCRSCGKIFCAECSNHMIPIPNEQLYHPVRVCATCFNDLRYQQIPAVDCKFAKTVENPASTSD